MSANTLTRLVPVPKNPIESGSDRHWAQIQKDLGSPLPDDFKEFGFAYGSGSIEDMSRLEIYVYQPFSATFLDKVKFHSDNLKAFKFGEGSDYIPYKVFPDTSGLLVWGGDLDGNELYWNTEGSPDKWSIVVRSEDNDYQEFPGPFTTFLANALERKIDVNIWPRPFFTDRSKIRFVPFSKPREANNSMPTTIYVLYSQNSNQANFWVRQVHDQPGVSYLVKTIKGMTKGLLKGIPNEYERQPVLTDVYLQDRLYQSDLILENAHQTVFVRCDPPV